MLDVPESKWIGSSAEVAVRAFPTSRHSRANLNAVNYNTATAISKPKTAIKIRSGQAGGDAIPAIVENASVRATYPLTNNS
ncbi:MAG: hypothetical protein K8R91_06145 [Phycisphaerae bacterium]|nr:hypothetical protein [Phycisphaerae bacterium]